MNEERDNDEAVERCDLRRRTKQFALRIIRMYIVLPKSAQAQVLGRQVLKSGTSPGAQYREACRARSTAEFVSKVESALQELDETEYWLELLVESGIVPCKRLAALRQEAGELIKIFTKMAINAKKKR
jgi:four helix bundle protein